MRYGAPASLVGCFSRNAADSTRRPGAATSAGAAYAAAAIRRDSHMDRNKAAAIDDLREAISAYYAYCESVEGGRMLVNADDDPADLIEAARLNVGERIRVCRSLGFTDEEIEQQVLADGNARRCGRGRLTGSATGSGTPSSHVHSRHAKSAKPRALQGLRRTAPDPPRPREGDGKEGVSGSSPDEGLAPRSLHTPHFLAFARRPPRGWRVSTGSATGVRKGSSEMATSRSRNATRSRISASSWST